MGANEKQVAGDHYRAKLQHWDFVVMMKLNYFEGQITKYVTRHRKKNGIQDLEKALHFAEKHLELLNTGAIPYTVGPMVESPLMARIALRDFIAANELSGLEADIIEEVCLHEPSMVVGLLNKLIEQERARNG